MLLDNQASHKHVILWGAVLGVALVISAIATAGQAGIRYKIHDKVQKGKGHPRLIIEATGGIDKGTIHLKRSDGHARDVPFNTLKEGDTKEIELKQPVGTYNYNVEVEATGIRGETVNMAFEFSATLAEKLDISVQKDAKMVAQGKLWMHSNRPLDRVDITVKKDSGELAHRETVELGGQKGTIKLEWPSVQEVGSVELKAHDVDGFWRGLRLQPFFVKIPHKEVNFNFGEATWDDSETPKLKGSLERIREAMEKHAHKGLQMRLYIAGYTDTVGSRSENRTLSRKRARAIGDWFSDELDMPIFYQGFGEDVLAVETPDETKEPKNRRAVYILGNAEPPTSEAIPRSNWKRLE